VPPGEVRVAVHYLMGYLHMVESQVMLQYQMTIHKQKNPAVDETEERVKELNDELAAKVDRLARREGEET